MNERYERIAAAPADRYRIERELGVGGMSSAATSRLRALAQQVAFASREQLCLEPRRAAVT